MLLVLPASVFTTECNPKYVHILSENTREAEIVETRSATDSHKIESGLEENGIRFGRG